MIRKYGTALLMLFLAACVSGNEQKLEEVKILLDGQQFDAAASKAREVLASDPSNQEASLLLASSLVGVATLDSSTVCKPEDKGILGKLACILDQEGQNESELETFLRVAPTKENVPTLEEATDLFQTLSAEVTDPAELKSIYLKLYLSKLFEIGGAVSTVVVTPGTVCDGINSSALTDAQDSRFRNNLSSVNSDGANAGLPSSFALNGRITKLQQKLDQLSTLPAFLVDQLTGAALGDCE